MSSLGEIKWFNEFEMRKAVKYAVEAHNAQVAPGLRADADAIAEQALDLFGTPDPTTIELIGAVQARVQADLSESRRRQGDLVRNQRERDRAAAAGRNWSIALTALEDAQMRVTRGHAEARGVQAAYDFEKAADRQREFV